MVDISIFKRGIWKTAGKCPVCRKRKVWSRRDTQAAYCWACGWNRNLERTTPAPEPTLASCAN